MSPEVFEYQTRLVAGARRGDAACLRELGCLVGGDFSTADSTIFHVGPDGLLQDPRGQRVCTRRDVYRSFVPFTAPDPSLEGLTTEAAIQDVRSCPPLAKAFATAALSHYNEVERRLLGDPWLDRREQTSIRQQLNALAAPGRPVWINWVHATPRWRHDELDAVREGWLDQPVDFDEEQWFAPGWQRRDIAMAAQAFKDLGLAGREFLEVELHEGTRWGLRQCAVLKCNPEQANLRAEQLELGARFEPAPAAAPAPPP